MHVSVICIAELTELAKARRHASAILVLRGQTAIFYRVFIACSINALILQAINAL